MIVKTLLQSFKDGRWLDDMDAQMWYIIFCLSVFNLLKNILKSKKIEKCVKQAYILLKNSIDAFLEPALKGPLPPEADSISQRTFKVYYTTIIRSTHAVKNLYAFIS